MELNLKILAPLLQCTSINRCALFMRAKKYILFYSSRPLKNYFFLSLTPCLSLSPKSLSLLSQITITQLSLHASLSPKSLSLLSPITQALILSQSLPTQPSQGPKSLTALILSHRHALNLPHSPPPARPSRPKPPINSPSLSSLPVTLSSSIIHRRQPDRLRPTLRIHVRPTPRIHFRSPPISLFSLL